MSWSALVSVRSIHQNTIVHASWMFLFTGSHVLSEKAMAPHSSTLAWKIPWTEEPGGLQSLGSWRVGHGWVTSLSLFTFMHWRRKWQPTPVFLPRESQGWQSLMGSVYGVTQSRTRLTRRSSSSSSSSYVLSGGFFAQYFEDYAGLLPLDRSISLYFFSWCKLLCFLKVKILSTTYFCMYKKRGLPWFGPAKYIGSESPRV